MQLSIDVSGSFERVRAGHDIAVAIATHPIEPGQRVLVRYRRPSSSTDSDSEVTREATWVENRDAKSYWRATLGPFRRGDRVEYRVEGEANGAPAEPVCGRFEVAPRLFIALLWHQHQPLYRDTSRDPGPGAYVKPWVRLHALRDYYSMAAILAEYPEVRVTFNLTPVLLRQLDEYGRSGVTDRALELTLAPAETLTEAEREELLSSFFDADWHHQIFVHERYRELFARRSGQEPFGDQEIRDLQMWFNLAWFGKEFRERDVELVTGETVSVKRFFDKGRDFRPSEVFQMVAEQRKILRAVVPIHRKLQELGQIEVSTSPFYHPILPLLIDTDRATVDRPGASLPPRFHHPEDAEAQVRAAVDLYRELFGRPPRGMWPAEGAVATFALGQFAGQGLAWIASDQGVLARSGRWGYEAHRPEVLCRPYRAEGFESLRLFFRAAPPSDDIGFHFQRAQDQVAAARSLVERLKADYGSGPHDDDRLVTLALDGENAWGAYRDGGRPFLHSLYAALAADPDVETTTFSDFIARPQAAGAADHTVHDLFTGSWIDELGSAPGADLGTWIGETEENRAWKLLGEVRDSIVGERGVPAESLEALYAAEGSDWFWWFGDDQESGSDQEFDDLFRMHLKNALRQAGKEVPSELEVHIVPHAVVWTFSKQSPVIRATDRLVVRTHCPGELDWWCDGEHANAGLHRVGGVMAGTGRYEIAIGPFPQGRELFLRFDCRHPNCPGDGSPCCQSVAYRVQIR